MFSNRILYACTHPADVALRSVEINGYPDISTAWLPPWRFMVVVAPLKLRKMVYLCSASLHHVISFTCSSAIKIEVSAKYSNGHSTAGLLKKPN